MSTKPVRARFTAELVEGHKGVTPVIVPFDPEEVWDELPIALDDRRYGWLVRGTMNRARFEGWIGHRWGRFFIILDAALRKAANAKVGDAIDVVVEPTDSASALRIALEQAKLTTAPSRRTRATRAAPATRSTR